MEPSRTIVRCPTCRTPVGWASNPYRPFCSERCRVVDLGHWAAGRYRVPGDPIDEDGDPPDGSSG